MPTAGGTQVDITHVRLKRHLNETDFSGKCRKRNICMMGRERKSKEVTEDRRSLLTNTNISIGLVFKRVI